MDKVYLRELFDAFKAELIRYRFMVVAIFLVIAFLVLCLGLLLPKNYTTTAVLYAEDSNIIGDLLKGNAEVTKIDRSEKASEIIYTKPIMLAVGKRAGLIKDDMTESEQLRIVDFIRGRISIERERSNDYFRLMFTANNPDSSFEVLNAIVAEFIENAARKKRDESMGAYTFIDSQVQIYKKQLEAAEEKLKDFKSQNTDGTEEQVNNRLAVLRQDLETLKINLEETQARTNSITQQLGNEGQYLQAKGQADELRQRRQTLIGQLEQLQLSYQDGYPDIISLKSQIAEVDQAIQKMQESGAIFGSGEKVENPLYEELRKQLSEADVEMRTQKRRMQSLMKLQSEELARQKRIAERQARLSELTRDNDVTRKLYDEMSEKRAAARLSMTLDQEGQGVTYRVQESPSFPLKPTGLRFIHFAILGPILAFLAPIGLLVAYIMVDPHLRSARMLQKQLPEDVNMIGVIPHYDSPIVQRLLRKDVLMLLAVAGSGMMIYIAAAAFWHLTNS
jgi:polysaccharide chain length determinant protein (PEP-CTERM system associated)